MPKSDYKHRGRDLAPEETDYMKRSGIPRISEFDAAHTDHLWSMLCDAHASILYIHFDLDVLSPKKFPATPVPISGDNSVSRTLSILHELKETFPVAGYGLFAYVPELNPNHMILPFLTYGLKV